MKGRLGWRMASLVGVLMGSVGIGLACLPDLEQTRVPIPSPNGADCGDGIVDIEAGEQCDPGPHDGGVVGCTARCQIDCDAGTLPSWVDPTSYHCYFLLSPEAGANDGLCVQSSAHTITFSGAAELQRVVANLNPKPQEFWLGLSLDGDGGTPATYSSIVNEPGYAQPSECRGCFGPAHPGPGGVLPPNKGHTGDGNRCVSWVFNSSSPRWFASDCDASLPTLCEREPVGQRSLECSPGFYCFTVATDVATSPKRPKIFYFSERRATKVEAEDLCHALSDAGTKGSLAILETAEEREQIFYELIRRDIGITDFWIGLSLIMQDGGANRWYWDNGKPLQDYALPWGDHEPRAILPGARAYGLQTGQSSSYVAPAQTYDTQLAHAQDPGVSPDGGPETHYVLCQVGD